MSVLTLLRCNKENRSICFHSLIYLFNREMETGKHYRAFHILGALKNNFSLKNTFFNQLQQNILAFVDLCVINDIFRSILYQIQFHVIL